MSQALLIPPSIHDDLPAVVRNELAALPPHSLEAFLEEYRRKTKSTGAAYVFWLLLGAHYAYVGKWGLFLLYWFTAGGFLIWAIVDIFRMPGIVRDYNKDVAVDVLRSLKAIQR